MTWEQKIQACQALGPKLSLKMRAPGDWYVSQQGVHRKDGEMLSGCVPSSSGTPEEAIDLFWFWLTDPAFYVVTYHFPIGDQKESCRKAVRWNGYMWADVDEKAVVAA